MAWVKTSEFQWVLEGEPTAIVTLHGGELPYCVGYWMGGKVTGSYTHIHNGKTYGGDIVLRCQASVEEKVHGETNMRFYGIGD